MVTSVLKRSIARTAILLAGLLFALSSTVHADNGAIVVTGSVDAKRSTLVRGSIASALRRASWSLVDVQFDRAQVSAIQECLTKGETAWACLSPVLSKQAIGQIVVVNLATDDTQGVRMNARLAAEGQTVVGYKDGYCSAPCQETALAQSTSDLIDQVLANAIERSGTTFLEVVTNPPDATISIDGRDVGPAGRGQKFPIRDGRHRVLAQLSGYHDADKEVDVRVGQTERVELTLVKVGGDDGHVVPPDRTPPRALQWTLIGGGVGIAIGGTLASYFLGKNSVPEPPEPLERSYYNTPAIIAASVGGAVAIASFVWLLSTPKHDSKAAASKPTISVSPTGAQAGWQFTF